MISIIKRLLRRLEPVEPVDPANPEPGQRWGLKGAEINQREAEEVIIISTTTDSVTYKFPNYYKDYTMHIIPFLWHYKPRKANQQ